MDIPFSNEHVGRGATRRHWPRAILCVLAPLWIACDREASPGEAQAAPKPPVPPPPAPPPPPPPDGSEPVGKVQQAIGNGSNDNGGAFPAVGYVRIFHADGTASACTGFLISPLWVATANHCITGVSNPPTWAKTEITDADLQVDAEIEFALRPTLLPGTFTFRHTFAKSGAIEVRMKRNVTSSSSDDSARDIALFKLDRMVPTALIQPLPIAGRNGRAACGDDFTATAVGYGPKHIVLAEGVDLVRSFNSSSGWTRDNTSDGNSLFENDWPIPFDYNGPLHGDSGGPLIGPDGTVCGVASRYYPTTTGFPFWYPAVGADEAAFDSAENLGFVQNHIVRNGHDEGVCEQGDPAKRGIDSDGDRIPDACDNCPSVANDAQLDHDGDRTGDACDPCPMTKLYGPQPDGDADGVGDACDDCPATANPPRACSTDADCGGGQSFCIAASGAEPVSAGHCSRQLDDRDGDAVGDACDSCVLVANGEAQGNANARSEAARAVETLGDVCDPVPVVGTRQRYIFAKNADKPATKALSSQILLSGNAAIGSSTAAPAAFDGTVGFRFCSCTVLDTEWKPHVLDAATCLATQCRIDPKAFEDDPSGRWCKITTDGGLDERRELHFDGSTHCSSDKGLAVPLGPTERCPVGEPLSILWRVAADESSPCLSEGGPPGIFWTHVLADGRYASARDRSTAGALRDSYTYVKPLPVVPRLDIEIPKARKCFQCDPKLHWDWKRRFISDPPDWGKLDPLARIRVNGERVLAVIGPEQAMDVTELVTPEARELLAADMRWLTPVEASARTRDGLSRMVAIPRSFGGPSSSVTELVMSSDGLSVAAIRERLQTAAPSARADARAVFSDSERAVYLVGGKGDPAAANEIWRHSLDDGSWSQLAAGEGPALSEARSVAYDAPRRRMFVLDGPQGSAGRLLAIDMDTGARSLMREGLSSSPEASVVALGDGDLVLVEPKGETEWLAQQLHPREDGGIEVVGVAHGRGQLVDEPVALDRGVALAVLDGDREQLVELERTAFQPQASPPESPTEPKPEPGPGPDPERKGGCSCSSHPRTAEWLWWLVPAGLWLGRRRRGSRP